MKIRLPSVIGSRTQEAFETIGSTQTLDVEQIGWKVCSSTVTGTSQVARMCASSCVAPKQAEIRSELQ